MTMLRLAVTVVGKVLELSAIAEPADVFLGGLRWNFQLFGYGKIGFAVLDLNRSEAKEGDLLEGAKKITEPFSLKTDASFNIAGDTRSKKNTLGTKSIFSITLLACFNVNDLKSR